MGACGLELAARPSACGVRQPQRLRGLWAALSLALLLQGRLHRCGRLLQGLGRQRGVQKEPVVHAVVLQEGVQCVLAACQAVAAKQTQLARLKRTNECPPGGCPAQSEQSQRGVHGTAHPA